MREPILEAEVKKWSSKTTDEVIAELAEPNCYEVSFGTKKYQCEVRLLENADAYLRLGIAIDDGTLMGSLHPFGGSFDIQKEQPSKA
jgi:hypothetical protein